MLAAAQNLSAGMQRIHFRIRLIGVNARLRGGTSPAAGRGRRRDAQRSRVSGVRRDPGRRRAGGCLPSELPCPAAIRASLGVAAAVIFFAGLAALGTVAGVRLTAAPASPFPASAVTPARAATPAPHRSFVLAKGTQLTNTAATSGLPIGRAARRHHLRAHAHRRRPGHREQLAPRVNRSRRNAAQVAKAGGLRWPAKGPAARMDRWHGSISTGRSTSAT
jgi:hypothetical protein